MTTNYNTQQPCVTLAEPVYHVAGEWWAVGCWVGGWWVRLCVWVGGLSVWFVCVCGLRFVVCGWCVGGLCGGGGWWLCLWLVCVVCVDFELYLRMIDLCGKHSQVGIFGWRCTIVK